MARTFTMHEFSQISFVLGDKPTVVKFPFTTSDKALIAHLLDLGAKEVTEPVPTKPKPKAKPKPKPEPVPEPIAEPVPEPIVEPVTYPVYPFPVTEPSQGGEA